MKSSLAIPNLDWWQKNSMPVKEIPISKKSLRSLSDVDRLIVAMATFPLLKRALIKAVIAFIVLVGGIIAGVILAKTNGQGSSSETALIVIAIAVVLSFIVSIKASSLIEGFDRIKGSKVLGLSYGFRFFKYIISIPTMFFGMMAGFILEMIKMVDKSKMLGMPRVGMPQNFGYDDLILYYAEYEKEVNSKSEIQAYSYGCKPLVDEALKVCNENIKKINADDTISFGDKEKYLRKWNAKKAKVEEVSKLVEDKTKPIAVK